MPYLAFGGCLFEFGLSFLLHGELDFGVNCTQNRSQTSSVTQRLYDSCKAVGRELAAKPSSGCLPEVLSLQVAVNYLLPRPISIGRMLVRASTNQVPWQVWQFGRTLYADTRPPHFSFVSCSCFSFATLQTFVPLSAPHHAHANTHTHTHTHTSSTF